MDISKAEEDADDKMEDCHVKGPLMSQLGEGSTGPMLGDLQDNMEDNSTVFTPPEISEPVVPCLDNVSTHSPVNVNISDDDILMDTGLSGNVVELLVKPTDDPGISSDLEQELLGDDIMDETPAVTSIPDTGNMSNVQDSCIIVTPIPQPPEEKSYDLDNQSEVLLTSSTAQEIENIKNPLTDNLVCSHSENETVHPEIKSDLPVEVTRELEDVAHVSSQVENGIENPEIEEMDEGTSLQRPLQETSLSENVQQVPMEMTIEDEELVQDTTSVVEVKDKEVKLEDSNDHTQPKCEEDGLLDVLKTETEEQKSISEGEKSECLEEAKMVENNKEAIVLKWYNEESNELEDGIVDTEQNTDSVMKTEIKECATNNELNQNTSSTKDIKIQNNVENETELVAVNSNIESKIEHISQDVNNTIGIAQPQQEKLSEIKKLAQVPLLTNTELEVKEVIDLIIQDLENIDIKKENAGIDNQAPLSQNLEEGIQILDKTIGNSDQNIEDVAVDNTSTVSIVFNSNDNNLTPIINVCETENNLELSSKTPLSQCQVKDSTDLRIDVLHSLQSNKPVVKVDNITTETVTQVPVSEDHTQTKGEEKMLSDNLETKIEDQRTVTDKEVKYEEAQMVANNKQAIVLKWYDVESHKLEDETQEQLETLTQDVVSDNLQAADSILIKTNVADSYSAKLTTSDLPLTKEDVEIGKIDTVEDSKSLDLASGTAEISLENIEASETVSLKIEEVAEIKVSKDNDSSLTISNKESTSELEVKQTETRVCIYEGKNKMVLETKSIPEIIKNTEVDEPLISDTDTLLKPELIVTESIKSEMTFPSSVPEIKDINISSIETSKNLEKESLSSNTVETTEELKNKSEICPPSLEREIAGSNSSDLATSLTYQRVECSLSSTETDVCNKAENSVNLESIPEVNKPEETPIAPANITEETVPLASLSETESKEEEKFMKLENIPEVNKPEETPIAPANITEETVPLASLSETESKEEEKFMKLENIPEVNKPEETQIAPANVTEETVPLEYLSETVSKDEEKLIKLENIPEVDIPEEIMVTATTSATETFPVASLSETGSDKEAENSVNVDTIPETSMPEEVLVAHTEITNSEIAVCAMVENPSLIEAGVKESFDKPEQTIDVNMKEINLEMSSSLITDGTVCHLPLTETVVTKIEISPEANKSEEVTNASDLQLMTKETGLNIEQQNSDHSKLIATANKPDCNTPITAMKVSDKIVSLPPSTETITTNTEQEMKPEDDMKIAIKTSDLNLTPSEEKIPLVSVAEFDVNKEEKNSKILENIPETSKPDGTLSTITEATKETVLLPALTENDINTEVNNSEILPIMPEIKKSEEIVSVTTKASEETALLPALTGNDINTEVNNSENLQIMPEIKQSEDIISVTTTASEETALLAALTETDKNEKTEKSETNVGEVENIVTKTSDLESPSSDLTNENVPLVTLTQSDVNVKEEVFMNIEPNSNTNKPEEDSAETPKTSKLEEPKVPEELINYQLGIEADLDKIDQKCARLEATSQEQILEESIASKATLSSDVTETTVPIIIVTEADDSKDNCKNLETIETEDILPVANVTANVDTLSSLMAKETTEILTLTETNEIKKEEKSDILDICPEELLIATSTANNLESSTLEMTEDAAPLASLTSSDVVKNEESTKVNLENSNSEVEPPITTTNPDTESTILPEATVCNQVNNVETSNVNSSEEIKTELNIPVSTSTLSSISCTSISESVTEVTENISVVEAKSEEIKQEENILNTSSEVMVSSVTSALEIAASPLPIVELSVNKIEIAEVNIEERQAEIAAINTLSLADDVMSMNETDLSAMEESIMNVEDSLEDDQPEMEALLLDTDLSDFEVPSARDLLSKTDDNPTEATVLSTETCVSETVDKEHSLEEAELVATNSTQAIATSNVVTDNENNINIVASDDDKKLDSEILLSTSTTCTSDLKSEVDNVLVKETECLNNEVDGLEFNKSEPESPLTTGDKNDLVKNDISLNENPFEETILLPSLTEINVNKENNDTEFLENLPEVMKSEEIISVTSKNSEETALLPLLIKSDTNENPETSKAEQKSPLAADNTCELLSILPEASSLSEIDVSAVEDSIMSVEVSDEESKPELEDLLLATDPSDFESTSIANVITEMGHSSNVDTSLQTNNLEVEALLLGTDTSDLKIEPSNIRRETEQQVSSSDVEKSDVTTDTNELKNTNLATVNENEIENDLSKNLENKIEGEAENTCTLSDILISSVVSCEGKSTSEMLISSNQDENNIDTKTITEKISIDEHNLETISNDDVCRESGIVTGGLEEINVNSHDNASDERETVQETIEEIVMNVVSATLSSAIDNVIPISANNEQINIENESLICSEKSEIKETPASKLEICDRSKSTGELIDNPNDENSSDSDDGFDDANAGFADFSESEEEAQESEQKSGIIILSSTSLAPEENNFLLEAESMNSVKEDSKPAASEIESNTETSISVDTQEVKETKKQEISTPVKEKILKIVTDEGIVQYIKIPVSFNIPNIAHMFSQSDNNLETVELQKEASPEKLKEDIICKGCETRLSSRHMYHPCAINWCRFCEETLPSNTTFELHTIEKHLVNMRTCAFCEKELASVQHLENHLKIHTQYRLAPSVCVGCKIQFRTNEGRREHSCSSPLLCTICNITMQSEERLLHHQETLHKGRSGGRLSRQPSIETPDLQAESEGIEENKQSSADSGTNEVSKIEDVSQGKEADGEPSNTPIDTISLSSSQTSETLSGEVGETLERVIAEVVKMRDSSGSGGSLENVWNILMKDNVNTDISKVLQENLDVTSVMSCDQEKNLPDSQQTTSSEIESIPLSSQEEKSGEEGMSVVENVEISSSDSEAERVKLSMAEMSENEESASDTSSVDKIKLLKHLTETIENLEKQENPEPEPQKQASAEESSETKFVCDICDRNLKTETDLVSHRTWHFESCAAPQNKEISDPTSLDDSLVTEESKQEAKVEENKVEMPVSNMDNQNTTSPTVELPNPIQLTMNSTDAEILECLAQIQEEQTGIRDYKLPDQIDQIIREVETNAIAKIASEALKDVKEQVDIEVDTEEISKELSKMSEAVFNTEMEREASEVTDNLPTTVNVEVTPDIVSAQDVIVGDVDTSSQAEVAIPDSQEIGNECVVSNSQSEITGIVRDVIDKAVSSVYEAEQEYATIIKKDVAASIVNTIGTSFEKAFSDTPLVSAQVVTIAEPTSTIPCPHCSHSFSSFTTLNSHFFDAKFCKFCEIQFPKDYELHMVEYHSLEKMCQFCDKTFRHAKDLSYHMKLHTSLQFKPFVCSKCNVAFNKTEYLKHNTCQASHKNKTVMELNLFCKECKIYFQSDISLENHMIENHSVKDVCPICKQKFNSLLELVTHLGSHNTIKQIVYKCQKCQLNTTDESEFDNHPCIQETQDLNVSSASSSNDILICEHCNGEFATEEDKLIHVCRDDKQENNKCETCDIKFELRLEYEEHMMSEHSTRDKCQFCLRQLQNLTALKSHIKIHTSIKHPLASLAPSPVKRMQEENVSEVPLKRSQRKKPKPEEEETIDDLNCKTCDVKYLKRDSFELHMMEFHSSLDSCQFCDMKFKSRTSLAQHIRIHTKLTHMPHKCEKCGSRFSKAAEMIVHRMGPCQVFTCEECDVVFECEEDYKIHTSEQHLLSCEFCMEYFKTKQELASHIKLHSSKDALICKDCNIKFKTVVEKTIHVCSQEKTELKCKICDKEFKSKFRFDKHAKEHETQTEDLPDKCNNCSRTFKTSQYLNVHLKYCVQKKTNTLQKKCKICKAEFRTQAQMNKHQCKSQDSLCKFCDTTFKNKKKFEQHMIENHTSPDTCQFCDKKFKQTQSLLIHLGKHTVFKPLKLKCEHCKLKYFQGEDMESHKCVAKKDFRCCACAREFTQAALLANHLTKQHNVLEFLPEVCGTCDTQFSNRRQLHRHPCPVGLPQEEAYVSLPFDNQVVASVKVKEEIEIKQEPLWDDYDGNSDTGTSSRGILCSHCEEVYDSKNQLNEHLCKVNYCKHCSQLLPSSKAFNSHMMSLHCSEKSCQFCDRVFKGTPELVKHVSLHTSIKHKFARKAAVAVKSKVAEKEKESNLCKICNKMFSTRQAFEIHMMSKHCLKSACQFCDQDFSKQEDLISHIATHTKLPYRYYNKCSKCDKKFLDDLQEICHKCPVDKKTDKPTEKAEDEKVKTNTAAATEKKKCMMCNKKFTSQPAFENHMMDLHQMKTTCQFCGFVCRTRPGLLRHLGKHTSIQAKSVCIVCSELCYLSKHDCSQKADNSEPSPKKQKTDNVTEVTTRKRTREDKLLDDFEDSSSSMDLESPSKLLKEAMDSIKCLLCVNVFDSKEDMYAHLRNHHRVDVNSLLQLQGVKVAEEETTSPSEAGSLDLTCQHCNVKFANQAELRLHGQKARVYCEFCKKTYPSQGEYESHMLEQHSMGRTCQFCGAQFSSKTGLLLHLRKHTSLKPIYFKCFGCGEKFRTKMERQRHDCLAWKCDSCEKKFDSEEALSVHKESHKPQATFQCESCDNTFLTEAELAEHLKEAHPQRVETRKRGRPGKNAPQISKQPRVEAKQEEIFPCEGHCTKIFASQSLLDIHKKCICKTCKKEFDTPKECDVHQIAEHPAFICKLCGQVFNKQIFLNKHLSWHDLNDATNSIATPPAPVPEPILGRRATVVAANIKRGPPPQMFKCDTCGKEVKSNFALQMHKKTHQVFQCELCNRVFASAQKLSAHIRLHPPPQVVEEDSDDDVVVILEMAPPSAGQGQFVLLD